MTYKAPDRIPYDEWFDRNYKYIPGKTKHPYDSWPVATLHEKMYQLSIDITYNVLFLKILII